MKHYILICVLLLVVACSKNKLDVTTGNLPSYDNNAPSLTRLVTFSSEDVMINGIKVTDWKPFDYSTGVVLPGVTPYFPHGKLQGAWYIPQQFMNSKGEATVKIYTPNFPPQEDYLADSFVVKDNYNQPMDYYLHSSSEIENANYKATAVPRTMAAAADPRNIRIRLVNLSADLGGATADKLTLAYANGTPVSTITSGIAYRGMSDYIELPYGAYQFKVLKDGTNLQLPSNPPMRTNLASLTDRSLNGTQNYYTPVRAFQPGGVYTIMVMTGIGDFQFSEYPISTPTFAVVNDVQAPRNITYARIQAVNAINENGMQVKIDGGTPTTVAYGTASNYQILIAGDHMITVTDAAGKTLAETHVSLKGSDNITVWAYPMADGTTSLTAVPNNMSGLRIVDPNTDGSDATNNVVDPLDSKLLGQTRFLNLCPDQPYVTFTGDNGTLFNERDFSSAAAAQNLQPGKPADPIKVPYPYVDLGFDNSVIIQAYSSIPGAVPGNRLKTVPSLSAKDFVAMPPFFYNNGRFGNEPGVYTVALIGRSNGSQQPKMIVIKHNQ